MFSEIYLSLRSFTGIKYALFRCISQMLFRNNGGQMSQTRCVLLEFIGGPFDGFKRTLSVALPDLPDVIALPLNRRTRKVFSLDGQDSAATAIYRLTCEDDRWQYRFCVLRPTDGFQRMASAGPQVKATQFDSSRNGLKQPFQT